MRDGDGLGSAPAALCDHVVKFVLSRTANCTSNPRQAMVGGLAKNVDILMVREVNKRNRLWRDEMGPWLDASIIGRKKEG